MKAVRITSDRHSASTKVLTDEGVPIHGITGIDVALRPNDLVRADIQLFVAEVDVNAVATFKIACPRTGELRAVRRIEFDDGEDITF